MTIKNNMSLGGLDVKQAIETGVQFFTAISSKKEAFMEENTNINVDTTAEEQVENEKEKSTKCYNCLEKCNPSNVPYCITKALTNAVMGDIDNGLIFVGANVGRINKLMTVHELMQEFQGN